VTPSPWSRLALRPRRPALALLAAGALLLVACEIVSITGPSSGVVGQTLSYDVTVAHDVPTISDATVWLMIDLPAAWSVTGAGYTGSVDGSPVGGTPDQAPPTAIDPGGCFTDAPPTGYQRAFFSAGPFPQIVAGDEGTLSVDLATAGAAGDFTLRFRAATETGEPESRSLSCFFEGEPATPVTETFDVSLAAPAVTEIPTLGTWGAGLLALLLAGVALRRLAG
jgi:hypothetical protein